MESHQSSSQDEPARLARTLERTWTVLILALLSVPAYAQRDPISRLLNTEITMTAKLES